MFNKKSIFFAVLFVFLGFLAMQVPVAQIQGSKSAFTIFDFFGPISSGFLGAWLGILTVALMQIFNFLAHGAKIADAGTILRFFPMLFAALYFSRNLGRISWLRAAIPALAIFAFVLHPIGRTVWYYSMYWLIPIIMLLFQGRFLIARALGATFMAHAVGGALWIWTFNLPAQVWHNLIPVVAIERLVFASGIALSYLLFNNILAWLAAKHFPQLATFVDKKRVLHGSI